MSDCFFVSDLHGIIQRWESLFKAVALERPRAVFLGGDLLPGPLKSLAAGGPPDDFIRSFMAPGMDSLRSRLGSAYPDIFLILGNDDGRAEEPVIREYEAQGLWHYAHGRKLLMDGHPVFGYSYVPPTPFRLKDWEKYDVSRFVDPGCVHPTEGLRSVKVSSSEIRYSTIARDLKELTEGEDLTRAIMLFHSPPYDTGLDRAALDGRKIDHVPLDVHVGSIAIARFIRSQQPMLTLHGHVHESCSITGSWKEEQGRTVMINAAHDGPELALVRFDPEDPGSARRELLPG